MDVCTLTRHSRRQAIKQATFCFGLKNVGCGRRAFLLPDEVVEQGLHQSTGQTQTGGKERQTGFSKKKKKKQAKSLYNFRNNCVFFCINTLKKLKDLDLPSNLISLTDLSSSTKGQEFLMN